MMSAGATSKPVSADKPAVAAPAKAVEKKKKVSKSTADHSKFKELKKNFRNGPQVTKACIGCHTEAAKQVHGTKHWSWEFLNPVTKQKLGKKHVINNFCTSIKTNQSFCSACHVGYGWKDDSFDFKKETNVDCLVCHDTTGTYKKLPGLAGHPNYKRMEWPPHSGKYREAVNLKKVARNVGKTSRATCGACHFYGGGGNGVKHGDMDSSLTNPSSYLDIHMDKDGLNFSCGKCHQSDAHKVTGSRYAPTAADDKGILIRGSKDDRNPTTCRACHGNTPHDDVEPKLNDHTNRIACQTCHIPAYARGPLGTKMSWDWSTAGRLSKKGERIQTRGSDGRVAYDSKKGDFTYERYVIPQYKWFNGNVKYTLFGDKVDGTEKVKISEFMGSADDPKSRIWPVKVFTGKQPYDVGNQTLAVFHTAGKDKAAFWGNYDWKKALEVGMASTGIKFSGKYDFVETESVWPITHMVAPKADALTCAQCHKDGGRMKDVDGIYMPGRNSNSIIDFIGFSLALLTLIGVFIHGGIRIIMSKRGY
ncbi:MAG: tetrathionate reductase family octaheme c-type cytochrome [Proteobacteria bacterium]|nr:tetrathionate reductase family octaheme c-type cytochrome [Pseudomonadota bacterium]